MNREDFRLASFRLENKSEVEATFKTNGRVVTEEFTAAVHNDLYAAFVAFDAVFVGLTGMKPNEKGKVEEVDVRKVHIFEGADERQIMITEVIRWKGGYANSMNTPKMPLSAVQTESKIEVEKLVNILEDEVYSLLFENKLGHDQQKLM